MFLEGCGLPDAWRDGGHFTIAELGFGTGLNVVAALDLWRRTRPPGARLTIFSIEAHPLAAADARRALAQWPEAGEVAEALAALWPGRARGFHRVDLGEFGAVLDVAVMDVAQALRDWQGRADAWFLDGFAPAVNPGMWSEAVLALVAARSAPGARAATYTVAGAVRRGLEAAGFALERKPGFGRKRERLEARLRGVREPRSPAPRVAIIGAGIAGAALARAFRVEGVAAVVFDPAGAGGGASGNPAALVTPRLDAGLGAGAGLFAQAFARAAALYEAEGGAVVIGRSALQLQTAERDAGRHATVAGSDLFEPGRLSLLSAEETAARLGEAAPAGLEIRDGLVIEPAALLAAWLPPVGRARVAALERRADGWALLSGAGETLMEADVVCLAAGLDCVALGQGLKMQAVRGQASWAEGVGAPQAAAFGGYVIPTRGGVLFGATHDRDDVDIAVRADDNARNLASVAKTLPRLAERLAAAPLRARAALRASTRDYMPIAGALGESGLFALAGLGSRGFTLAPLLAEHIVALALGRPSPLPAPMARLGDPERLKEQAHRGAV